MAGYRLIKWVGDPPALKPNGWTPANWRYENARTIALRRFSSRLITPYDLVTLPDGSKAKKANGISREYFWPKDHPTFVIEMLEADARILLARQPNEFKDVTDVPERLWPEVVTTPVIKTPRPQQPQQQSNRQFVMPGNFYAPNRLEYPHEAGQQNPLPYLGPPRR